jgi:cytochrome c biogenesis factor
MQVAAAAVLFVGASGSADSARRRALTQMGRTSYLAAGGAVLVAVVALFRALLGNDFSLRYVATYTSVLLSRQPAVMAFWAGPEGTVLWFTAMLAVSGAVATVLHRRRQALTPLATATLAVVSVAGLLALCVGASPFARLATAPQEGRGFPPLLLHNGMLLQPPLLLLGLALTAVPFAFVAAHVAGSMRRSPSASRDDDAWRGLAHRWLVLAWVCLTAALGVGLWWAQQQLGWFGYFFTWEPYASAPMLPWLAVTALLVVLVSEADRERGAWWLAAFVAFAFLLALFALARARAGIAASIRAVDARPSTFLLVLAVMGVLLMAAIAAAAMRKRVARARMGGMLAIIGVVVLAAGLGASYWRRDLTTGVDIGQQVEVRDPFGAPWRFTSQGLSSYQESAYTVMAVVLNATAGGRRAGLLTSQQRQYYDAADNEIYEPMTRVGALTRWNQTVTLAFLGAIDRTSAAVRVSFVPMVTAVWFGLVLSVLGVALASWPVEPLPAVRARSRHCASCGAPRVVDEARYCTVCGSPLSP